MSETKLWRTAWRVRQRRQGKQLATIDDLVEYVKASTSTCGIDLKKKPLDELYPKKKTSKI